MAPDQNCICGEINARHCPVHNEPAAREFWATQHPLELDGIYIMSEFKEQISDLETIESSFKVIEYSAYKRAKLEAQVTNSNWPHEKTLHAELGKERARYAKAILALKQIYDDGIVRDRPCEIAENVLYELGEFT